ncbi:MAG: hypothetical protein NT091_04485 [Candidatus Falkowbacteria bacterium]|nr:hypothetical protein [Candidatus Falkowbacteria bacterium]
MKNSTLVRRGAVHAIGVFTYARLLAIFFSKASDWFGKEDKSIITPVAGLMLFMFSALVTGGLVLGKPLMLYVDGQKKDGVKLLFFTGMGMFVLMLLAFVVLWLMK